MTIHVYAHQAKGIAQDKLVDSYEFCCWAELKKWINNPKLVPHRCPKCKANRSDST